MVKVNLKEGVGNRHQETLGEGRSFLALAK
jgi:hypothetical protein